MGPGCVTNQNVYRVAVVTGSRAEFGLLERILTLLDRSAWCQLVLLAAGMHLVERLGRTVGEVEEKFAVAARVPMDPPEDSRKGMAWAVADGLRGFADELEHLRPDLLLVLGDRTEFFAAALAASYLGVPVAHIHGGDLTGNPVDDLQRDTVSRLATLHFPATRRSAERLEGIGVDGTIVVAGAPGLDAVVGRTARPRERLARDLSVPDRPWIVVLYHPNPAHPKRAGSETEEVLRAATRLASEWAGFVTIVLPNNDAGCESVLAAIEPYSDTRSSKAFRNLAREDYLDLLSHARLLVGNSSSGLIESVALGVAVVNVGDRQDGRERDANVVDSVPEEEAIVRAAQAALTDPTVDAALTSGRSVYGTGTASQRIVDSMYEFLVTESTAVVTASPAAGKETGP